MKIVFFTIVEFVNRALCEFLLYVKIHKLTQKEIASTYLVTKLHFLDTTPKEMNCIKRVNVS